MPLLFLCRTAPVALLPLEKACFFSVRCCLALKQSGVSKRAQCPLMYQPRALPISLLCQEM